MSSKRPASLLLVEDNVDLANVTSEFLGLFGLEVQIAESGNQALEMAKTFRPQIVLCDLSLPDMSGLEVVRRLRADPQTRTAVFAVVTAMTRAEISELEKQSAGDVDLFLSKPIRGDDVNELLDRVA